MSLRFFSVKECINHLTYDELEKLKSEIEEIEKRREEWAQEKVEEMVINLTPKWAKGFRSIKYEDNIVIYSESLKVQIFPKGLYVYKFFKVSNYWGKIAEIDNLTFEKQKVESYNVHYCNGFNKNSIFKCNTNEIKFEEWIDISIKFFTKLFLNFDNINQAYLDRLNS